MNSTTPPAALNRLALKSFKTVKWMSEETLCFTALVHLDGKLIGEASNEGHGGCTFIHYVNDAAKTAGETFAKSIDPRDVAGWEFMADKGFTLDCLVDILSEEKEKEDAAKKLISKIRRDAVKKVMFITTETPKGSYRSFKNVTVVNRQKAVDSARVIPGFVALVSEMPDEQIRAHFAI